MVFTPMMSLAAATIFISLICHALFKELDVNLFSREISNVTPIHNCIRRIVFNTAAETLYLARRKTHKQMIFLSINAANKNGVYYIAKVIAVQDDLSECLLVLTIDDDACGDDNVRAAEVVDHSMLKLDHIDWKATLQNVNADAGGRGAHI